MRLRLGWQPRTRHDGARGAAGRDQQAWHLCTRRWLSAMAVGAMPWLSDVDWGWGCAGTGSSQSLDWTFAAMHARRDRRRGPPNEPIGYPSCPHPPHHHPVHQLVRLTDASRPWSLFRQSRSARQPTPSPSMGCAFSPAGTRDRSPTPSVSPHLPLASPAPSSTLSPLPTPLRCRPPFPRQRPHPLSWMGVNNRHQHNERCLAVPQPS